MPRPATAYLAISAQRKFGCYLQAARTVTQNAPRWPDARHSEFLRVYGSVILTICPAPWAPAPMLEMYSAPSGPHAQALTRFLYGYSARRFRVRTSPEVSSLKQSDI
jgi:hypothetical protein